MIITAYHGTNQEFAEFDFSRLGSCTSDMSNASIIGAFFTQNLEYAKNYAMNAIAENGGEITILKCKIEYTSTEEFRADDLERISEMMGGIELKASLQAAGYDAILVDVGNGWADEICVFSANQILNIKKLDITE